VALRIHCRSGHSSTHWHGSKEGVDHIGNSEVIELLALIDRVAILASESFANSKMLKCASHERSYGSSSDL